MPKVGDEESNDQTEANDAFQQEAISNVVPIDVEDNVQYCKVVLKLRIFQKVKKSKGITMKMKCITYLILI